ncbi:MAG TPA: YceI family protein [Burkholderiales bacterium]|nr:YceI family protein [Burkholderiales bacterium]
MRRGTLAASAALVLLVAGCAELLRVEAPVGPPPEFPEGYYRQALKEGKPVYRVDPRESLVVIEVRRGGSLARLGHDHVVAGHDLTGYVAPGEGRADLYAVVANLVVDEPGLRKEAGFDTQPTDSDIDGTRANMLNHVLDAEKFPYAVIAVKDADAKRKQGTLAVAVTLHGQTRSFQVPAEIEADEQSIAVSGKLSFNQTDFGITPYSLLGGAIAVKDGLALRFRVRAKRVAE